MSSMTRKAKNEAAQHAIKKRSIVRAACNECRLRKAKCDTVRPRCGQCRTRELECAYATQNAEETRYMALRRESEGLKNKVRELQDLVDDLMTKPESVSPARPGTQQPGQSGHDSGNDLSAKEATSLVHWPRQINAAEACIPNHPLRELGINTARMNLDGQLLVDHDKAYPKLMPFRDPQTIAHNLLDPRRASRIDNLVKSQLEFHCINDGGDLWMSGHLCDHRLRDLDITHWTDVPISNQQAAAAISLYMETEHPVIALFDAGLFIGDLVYKRTDFCSSFLVNALLSFAIQPYRFCSSSAWDLHLAFFARGKELWAADRHSESLLHLGALRLMDFSGAIGGLDNEARLFHSENHRLGERLGSYCVGLFHVCLKSEPIISGAFRILTPECISQTAFYYLEPMPAPPLPLPIPGTSGFPLPHYVGDTVTFSCELWIIAARAFRHREDAGMSEKVPFEVVESTYCALLEWVVGLPRRCARSDLSPHHVITMHINYHCIVVSLMRPWMGKGLILRASPSISCFSDDVYHTSLAHLKRILILYQLNYPEARYHCYWNPVITYIAHAVINTASDPEWRFYFLICLQAFRRLSVLYPFAAICYKGIITAALARGRLSTATARHLLWQLTHGHRREAIRDTSSSRILLDYDHSKNVDVIVKDLEKIALVKEVDYDGEEQLQ